MREICLKLTETEVLAIKLGLSRCRQAALDRGDYDAAAMFRALCGKVETQEKQA